ncbi:hypothetical protein [Kribbella sp. NPDC004875]|uniref:hypothetical protein n=1 Tax=Kribbella sp. NPDC004875 TaxID=3364107 RepID=UPI0036B02B3C
MADHHADHQVDFRGGGDRRPDPLIDSVRTATLRDEATAVLAGYHHLDHEEAGLLLLLLADCLGCSVDALSAELVRADAARDLSRFGLAD